MRFFILIIFWSISFSVMASDVNGRVQVLGAGATSCAEFNHVLDNMAQLNEGDINGDVVVFSQLLGWLHGFLSATSVYTEETYDITGGMGREEIVHWVVNYCLENPDQYLGDLAQKFAIELYPSRSKIEPK